MTDIVNLSNGGIKLNNSTGTIILDKNEMCAVCMKIKMRSMKELLQCVIASIKGNRWCFELTQEEVMNDDDLLDEMLEEIEYDNMEINSTNILYLLDKYVDRAES